MRWLRPSWPRRSEMLCDSDLPLRLRYAPSFTLPGANGTGPPNPGRPAVAGALADADSAGVADFDGVGPAVAAAGPRLVPGLALVVAVAPAGVVLGAGAASATRDTREHAAGRVANAASVSSPRRGSRGRPDGAAVMILLAYGTSPRRRLPGRNA
ncbi:hypothetical protein KRMM14A1004_17230 [Krasilnikovia sp. MM14-A1004]